MSCASASSSFRACSKDEFVSLSLRERVGVRGGVAPAWWTPSEGIGVTHEERATEATELHRRVQDERGQSSFGGWPEHLRSRSRAGSRTFSSNALGRTSASRPGKEREGLADDGRARGTG